jgi:hypothetical protein
MHVLGTTNHDVISSSFIVADDDGDGDEVDNNNSR